MHKKRNTTWKNFILLMSYISILIIGITFFIYHNAINVMTKEISNVNLNQAYQLENNMIRLLEQTDHLAASLCVQQSTNNFWNHEDPEKLNDDFYIDLSSQLKGYVYSMNDSIYSISLYSEKHNRIIDQYMKEPYVLTGTEKDSRENVEWIYCLEDMGTEKVKNKVIIRAVNNRYPYVLTMIKQYASGSGYGAVAIDINLQELYSVIWPETVQDTKVWVLDGKGRVIVREKKNELYIDAGEFSELQYFEKEVREKSALYTSGEVPLTYAQTYRDDYDMFIVSVTELQDFEKQMWVARAETIVIGFVCIVVSCLFGLLYVKIANKPIKKILGILQNNMEDSENPKIAYESEEQEIVEHIVSNIQKNKNLKNELELRMGILNKTQLQALKAQVNPHFLFNTLNVIVMLIDSEIEDSMAAQVTTDLAAVLRYALSDDDLVNLEDELENTRKYLNIMEQRYLGRFQTEIHIDDDLLNAKVPKLTLQPLIENAIFHGIVAMEPNHPGLLSIFGTKQLIRLKEEDIWAIKLEICDNGKGMIADEIEAVMKSIEDEQITMSHIGIQNVAKRLMLLFPQKSRVEISSDVGKGTVITLFFPFV